MRAATADPGEVHHVHPDPDEPLSEVLVDSVAELADTDPADLPSLDARINVAALNRLWETDGPDDPAVGCLTFTYGGYVVVARSTGPVFLREAQE